ncbi:MAG: serine/threonine-protein kinase [Planctomycetota bacterium]
MANVLDGRFQIEELLSQGAGGQVFRGTDLVNGEPIAVKILHPASARSEEFLSRFRRECRLLVELDHPNAVRVHGSGITPEGLPYVAMELVGGKTLSGLVGEKGSLSAEEMAVYLAQIAEVLDAAHAKNVLHRDIKPGNIMIMAAPDGKPIVKVLDFGIAKIMGNDQMNATVVTTAGIAVGTPAYMSPEQAMGKPLGVPSDIYSLGITVFAALTGQLPFEGKNDLQTMLAHVRAEIPRFADKNPANRVPVAVEGVVRSALAKPPEDRPASAGDFARRFADALLRREPERVLREEQRPARQLAPILVSPPASASRGNTAEIQPWMLAIIAAAIVGGVLLAAFFRG